MLRGRYGDEMRCGKSFLRRSASPAVAEGTPQAALSPESKNQGQGLEWDQEVGPSTGQEGAPPCALGTEPNVGAGAYAAQGGAGKEGRENRSSWASRQARASGPAQEAGAHVEIGGI